MVQQFAEVSAAEARSQVDLGRWNLAISFGTDIRILFPDAVLDIDESLWDARTAMLTAAREGDRWGDVSMVACELKLLAPERSASLGLADDFDRLNYELPSPFDHAGAFLARAYELAILFPERATEIDAYPEFLPTLLEAAAQLPVERYMDYPWLMAHLRVVYPDHEVVLDEQHLSSAVRDCAIALSSATSGGKAMGFASNAAPLKLLAATRIELTDRGPVAVLD
jgi:hypothetical protein